MALDLSTPFVWGSGGAQMTPTEIEAQRKVAQAMMAKGGDYSPVQSWTQGAARVAQAMFGGLMAHDANSAAKANQEAESQLLTSIVGGGTPSAASASTAPASPVTSAPLPSIGSTAPDSGLSDAITKVASARGVDPAYMTRLAMVESGGNPNATTSLSSAKGPFQFIDSTAQHYGLTNPTDTAASADAAARLTLDNKAALTQALGREPTPGELYLAHQQGAAGAAKILANPDAPIESVIGTRAAANNGAVPGMTAGQFANKWTSRFSDIGAPQVAQADPAALPANSHPAQGFAVPGAMPPAASVNPALARAIASPYTSEGTKKILSLILTQQMSAAQKANDPLHQLQIQQAQKSLSKSDAPTSVQEYEYYASHLPPGQSPMDYSTWSVAKARAAATTITNNVGDGETSFQKEAGKVQANRFNDLAAEGPQAKQMIADVNTLTDLGKSIGTGRGAQVKAALGPYAEALGIKIDGLSDIQAYEAVVNRVAPTLRVKGSGAQSDFELKNFLKSLPSLGNTPEGNNIAATVLQGFQQNKVLSAEIGSKALNGEITRAEADRQLRELPDPMTPYREYRKGHPATPQGASKPAAPAQGPAEGATAVNPQTGERLIRKGGKWVPFT